MGSTRVKTPSVFGGAGLSINRTFASLGPIYVGPMFAYVSHMLPQVGHMLALGWPLWALRWRYVGLSCPYLAPICWPYVGLREIFGALSSPYNLRLLRPPLKALAVAWSGKAQRLLGIYTALLYGLRHLSRFAYLRWFTGLINIIFTSPAWVWQIISILSYLGPGFTDPRTQNLIPKDTKQYFKLLAAILTSLVPLPLCFLSVPQLVFSSLYLVVAAFGRLTAIQLVFLPSAQSVGLPNEVQWRMLMHRLLKVLSMKNVAAVQAPTTPPLLGLGASEAKNTLKRTCFWKNNCGETL